MKEYKSDIAVLIANSKNTIEIIKQNWQFYNNFKENEFATLGRTTVSAMVLSQVFVDFYTCIETLLFRISQQFENNLRKEQWHKELLQKMSLTIPKIRPAVLSKRTELLLSEILRFRHFKRYYFDFDYDWAKLDLIDNKYKEVYPLIINDTLEFIEFLNEIQNVEQQKPT